MGVAENHNSGPNPRKVMELRSPNDGRIVSISQNLGPGSQACNLDPEGISPACAAVQESIARGADVVVLGKFGKQELHGGGLNDAFCRRGWLLGAASAKFAAFAAMRQSAAPTAATRWWLNFIGTILTSNGTWAGPYKGRLALLRLVSVLC